MHSQFFSTLLAAAATTKKPYKRQVAYLESTGTQYIDTGLIDYVQTHLYRLVNTVAFTSTAQSQTGANGVLQVVYESGNFGISAWQLSYAIAVNEVFTYEEYGNDQNTTTLIVDGVSSSRDWGSNNYGGSILLFALRDSGLSMHYALMRCYGLKVYSNATGYLVRDLIPVIDWNDRPAMYDKVSKQLFYNQGSGEFMYPMGDDDSFTIDLALTDANLQFGVQPYWNAGGYCNIDWGDGNTQAATTSGTALTHTYAEAGTYRVKVRGDMRQFRVGSTNPGAVIDCNGNFSALGNITNGYQMFNNCSNATFAWVMDDIWTGWSSIEQMFDNCNAPVIVNALPPGMRYIWHAFFNAKFLRANIDAIAANAPDNGWTESTLTVERLFTSAGSGNTPGTVTGHIATFMRKFPNVNNVNYGFQGTNTTTFGSNDYFEITLTTTEANQSWGFTATSSAGRWYCFDWGDGTAVTANKNLDVFTSGTKVSHTFATPGTYHIKLATAPCSIVFDPYDSDNGNWEALGQPAEPIDGVQGVFIKSGTEVISSAMRMSGTTITGGQSQHVYNYGRLTNAQLVNSGAIYVSYGGLIQQATVMGSGASQPWIYIYSGGIADNITVSSAGRLMANRGNASNVTAYMGGYVYADSAYVQNLVLSGGNAYLLTNAEIKNIIVFPGGQARVYGRASAYNIDVHSRGSAQVELYSLISGAVISSSGTLIVASGGTALAVTSSSGAIVTVADGGYIEYVTP